MRTGRRGSRPGCGPRPRPTPGCRYPPRDPGCRRGGRPGPPTAISVQLRVRSDGFSNTRATPRPARTGDSPAGSARPAPAPWPGRRGRRRRCPARGGSRPEAPRRRSGGGHDPARPSSRASCGPGAGPAASGSRARSTMATASSISASDTSSDGASRRTSGRGALTTRPSASARRQAAAAHLVGRARRPAAAPRPGPRPRRGASLEPGPQAGTRDPGPGRDVLGLHHRQGGPCRRHGQRLAPEGAAVVAGHEGGRHFGPGPARPDGHPVAEGLGHGDHVGLDAEVLEPEPPPGPAEPGLDLVHHEQDVPVACTAGGRPTR